MRIINREVQPFYVLLLIILALISFIYNMCLNGENDAVAFCSLLLVLVLMLAPIIYD